MYNSCVVLPLKMSAPGKLFKKSPEEEELFQNTQKVLLGSAKVGGTVRNQVIC